MNIHSVDLEFLERTHILQSEQEHCRITFHGLKNYNFDHFYHGFDNMNILKHLSVNIGEITVR